MVALMDKVISKDSRPNFANWRSSCSVRKVLFLEDNDTESSDDEMEIDSSGSLNTSKNSDSDSDYFENTSIDTRPSSHLKVVKKAENAEDYLSLFQRVDTMDFMHSCTISTMQVNNCKKRSRDENGESHIKKRRIF